MRIEHVALWIDDLTGVRNFYVTYFDAVSGSGAMLDGPRRTGDGYYESVVLDPDGNRIEITV